MDLLDRFRARLAHTNHTAFSEELPTHAEDMAKAALGLRKWLGNANQTGRDARGIAIAVGAFFSSGTIPGYRDAKYLCFGVATPNGSSERRIIEETSLLRTLLDHVVEYITQPKKFRRCYQGLFRGYLRYPGHHTSNPDGRTGWHALRTFLSNYVDLIVVSKPELDWTVTLAQHANLLGESPCTPYGKRLLGGDRSVLEELKQRLGVDDESWVMSELILSQVDAAVALEDDTQFKEHIPTLLELLAPHQLLVTPGISRILRRYAQCDLQEEHPGLRDLALQLWKSPWLDANKALWVEYVGEAATAMVGLWLKQRSIRDFFELLQSDGKADSDRMEFWLQYAEAIDEVWLALGESSWYNNKPDYRRIRRQMEGRCMMLEGGNQKQDNAFLMKIGDHLVIEFARQNNACHIFDARRMPFVLGQRSVMGTQEGLKNTTHVGHRRKLLHKQGWQLDFKYYLQWHVGVTPSLQIKRAARAEPARRVTHEGASNASAHSISGVRTVIVQPTGRPIDAQPFQDQAFILLQKICAAHQVSLVDDRRLSGKVFVRTGTDNLILRQILTNQGFGFVDDNVGWSRTWR